MEKWELASKLPYRLAEDVMATRKGLVFDDSFEAAYFTGQSSEDVNLPATSDFKWLVPWPEARWLLYQKNKPWCYAHKPTNVIVCCSSSMDYVPEVDSNPLHRSASSICEDAMAFDILFQCLVNFGESNDE